MQVRARHIYSMFALFSTMLGLYGARQMQQAIKHTTHIACDFDGIIASKTQDAIAISIDQHYTIESTHQLIEQIHKQFPCINDTTVTHLPNGLVTYDIQARDPLCCVNAQWMLMRDGVLVPKEQVSTYKHTEVPTITLATLSLEQKTVSDACVQFIARAPRALFNAYTVAWQNATHIALQDKQYPTVKVLCTADTVFDEQFFLVNKQVNERLCQKKNKHMQRKQWLVDRRFAKQVIIKNGKG